jgi:tetratricopeptide (TPR) repeat protein
MGVVYSAFDPGLDRRVALKLLRSDPGDGADRGERRLIREAKATAKLAHPNVITIHDVGSNEYGVFLAMELVEGATLRAWLGEGQRTWSEVLASFVAAGRGLAAAHSVGLVHRDFKPENVMVGTDGRVRVLDFGLAVPVGEDTAPESELEELSSGKLAEVGDSVTRGIIGTPAYMAPEQHLGMAMDARTDQFSFCVALYEGLYGQRPFSGKTRPALVLAVTSGTITEVPRGRSVPAWVRTALVRGLSPKPRDRWPSMDDLLHELSRDPARRRRRIGVGIVALGIIGGGAWLSGSDVDQVCSGAHLKVDPVWNEARSEQLGAGIGRVGGDFGNETWTLATEHIRAYVSEWADEHRSACEATSVRQEQSGALLDERMRCLDRQLAELDALLTVMAEPDLEMVSRTLPGLADLPAPSRCADTERLALDSRTEDIKLPEQTVRELDEGLASARALRRAGRFSASAARASEVSVMAEAIGARRSHANALAVLGLAQLDAGELVSAQTSLADAFFEARRSDDSRVAVDAASSLIFALARQGRHPEAITWSRHAEAEVVRRGNLPDDLSQFANNLGKAYQRQGKYEQAAAEHRRALAAVGEGESLRKAQFLNSLAIALMRLDQGQEALDSYETALEIRTRILGDRHPHIASLLNNMGIIYRNRGDLDAALSNYERALEIRRATIGANHPHVAASLTNLGVVHAMKGDYAAALQAFVDARAVWEGRLGPGHPDVATADNSIGKTLVLMGRHGEAERVLAAAVEHQLAALGREHPDVAMTRSNLGEARLGMGEYAAALAEFERALEIYAEAFEADHPRRAHPLTGRGESLLELGRKEAASPLEQAVKLLERPGSPQEELARARFALARAVWSSDPERSRELAALAGEGLRHATASADVQRRLGAVETWVHEHP